MGIDAAITDLVAISMNVARLDHPSAEDMNRLDDAEVTLRAAIRQWQASAEPAPPPAVPVVTITLSREDAEFAQQLFDASYPWFGLAKFRDRFSQALEAALRGADLASESEGARDGQ